MSLSIPSVFITVGTTSFDTLVEQFLTNPLVIQTIVYHLGYEKIVFQIGRSIHEPDYVRDTCVNHLTSAHSVCDLSLENVIVEAYRYKSDLLDDMKSAGLIISHAGAGSCVEALSVGGRCLDVQLDFQATLVVVINDLLMNNHQSELAEALERDGYAFASSSPSALLDVLTDASKTANLLNPMKRRSFNSSSRKLWLNGDQQQALTLLSKHLSHLCGFNS